jgi:hypothetical protein
MNTESNKPVITPAMLHKDPYEVRFMNSTDTFKPNLYYVVRFFRSANMDCVGAVEAKGNELVEEIGKIMKRENLILIRSALEAYTGDVVLTDDEIIAMFTPVLTDTINWSQLMLYVEQYAHKNGVSFKSLEPLCNPADHNVAFETLAPSLEIPESAYNDLLSTNPDRLFKNEHGVVYYLAHGSTSLMDRTTLLKPLSHKMGIEIESDAS